MDSYKIITNKLLTLLCFLILYLTLSVGEVAERLGMSRVALSRVLNGKAAVSANLAIRLEMAGVSTARAWLAMQTNYDLSKALKRKQPKIDLLSVRSY
ncbi:MULTISPECIES: HigA family addiction module antitoxin [Bartonella]|uniref:HigA family addiction module antitoxin n=1 Tax=Bartonella TaxID=773 RepID=UPI003857E067